MCGEAASIALTGELKGAQMRFRACVQFASARGWNDKAQFATLCALGVQWDVATFREEMRETSMDSLDFGHLWALLLSRRHMLINDPVGVSAWWQSALQFGLAQEWSIGICPMIISILPWVNRCLPSVATEMERELARITGSETIDKIPLYGLSLNDT